MKKLQNNTSDTNLSILDSLAANICILDNMGVIIAVNKAWCDFAEANCMSLPDYGIGANYLNISDSAFGDSTEGAKEFADGIRSVISGSQTQFNMEYPCHSPEEERWFEGKVTPLRDSPSLQIIVAHENITQRKRNELLARKYAEELKKINLEKDKLFTIISHDLKNTFHGLLSLTDILENDVKTLNENEISNISGEISNALKAQYKQLENLLTWSLLQLGQIRVFESKVNVRNIVNQSMDLLRSSYIKKNIDVQNEIEEDLFLIADETLLGLIVQNFLVNAIKFTYDSGNIRIYSKADNGYLGITVEDTGTGIKIDDINKLFDLSVHYTVPGTNGESGSGLGLLICKEIAELMKAEILVESNPGYGSSFTILLPAFSEL